MNDIRIDLSLTEVQRAAQAAALRMREENAAFRPPAGLVCREETAGETPYYHIRTLQEETSGDVLFMCHGGGLFLPVRRQNLEMACLLARLLHAEAVIADYSLLPQGRFPVPGTECLPVYGKARERGGRVAVLADSIGAAIALHMLELAKDQGMAPADALLLFYPVLDPATASYPSAALDDRASWHLSSNASMWEEYLKDVKDEEDQAVPMRRPDLSFLPATYLETAGTDILRDEGLAFGAKLRREGIPVEEWTVPQVHGFDADLRAPDTLDALKRRIAFLRRCFQQQT